MKLKRSICTEKGSLKVLIKTNEVSTRGQDQRMTNSMVVSSVSPFSPGFQRPKGRDVFWISTVTNAALFPRFSLFTSAGGWRHIGNDFIKLAGRFVSQD